MAREGSRFTFAQLKRVLDNWEEIATENGGKMELRKRIFTEKGILEQMVNYKRKYAIHNSLLFFDINIPHERLKIKISSSEVKTPILSFKYNNSKQFYFSIRDEDFMDKISKYFGQNEVEINDKEFDSSFFLETNKPEFLKEFLDIRIIDWLKKIKIAYFDYNSPKSKNALTIYCSINELDKLAIEYTLNMFKYCISKIKSIELKNES
ncbi:MAG: hypothetical protein ACEPOW_14645 [Bacteroidales bacterium]